MPNNPLGLSFSPTTQQQGVGPGGGSGPSQSQFSPQDAIKILSLRLPRTVGAAAPIPGALLNAAGGAGFGGGGGQFGAAGGNLEQLLALLYGRRALPGVGNDLSASLANTLFGDFNGPQTSSPMFGGVSGLPEAPRDRAPSDVTPLPWMPSAAPPPAFTFQKPGAPAEGSAYIPPPPAEPRPGQTVYSPPSAGLQWEPNWSTPSRTERAI